jgi:NAD(P)-dependent dehydrogenase (short-subunit alcohol dehydrogenase family)
MKIFVAGATGALGRRLVPLLVANGHTVVGTTRTPDKAEALRAAGATPVVLDALDRDAVIDALTRAEPEVVVHQLTALAGFTDFRKLEEGFAATNRLRTEGTDHLLEGIRRLPVRRIVAQSYAGPGFFARTGGPIKTEEDPFDPDPPAALRRTVEAVRYLERAVLEAEGIQGTCFATEASTARAPRPGRAACSSRPSGAASSPSSRAARECGRSSTSTTRPPRPWRPSSAAGRASTTSSMTTRRRSPSGSPAWPRRSGPSRPGACPPGWLGCSWASTGWS